MPRRSGAVHVATTRRKVGDRVYESHLLRRSVRIDGKVRHETLGNVSHLPAELRELVRRALKGETFVPANEALECVRSLPHGHVAAVLGTMDRLGLPALLAHRPSAERARVLAMVAARVLQPSSKLALARGLDPRSCSSTLPSMLGVEGSTANDLYAALDWLHERQKRVEDKLARRHLKDGCFVLYDLTSTYFEGRTCPLAHYGYSRDGKKQKRQIVVGLLTTKEGCPVSVEVFEGQTSDATTVAKQIDTLRKRWGLTRVVLVGDRGVLTSARIREDLSTHEGMGWVTALRNPQIRSLVASRAVTPSLFDERNLVEIQSPDFPGERLVACRNPLLADERARKRQALLLATEAKFEAIRQATLRPQRALKGAVRIARRVAKVEDRFQVAKLFRQQITDTGFSYERDNEKIAQEEALDGIYIIRARVPDAEMSAEEVVSAYKGLAVVERAFRCLKSVTLHLRPIHHRKDNRVRSHVFACAMAYYVEWHMRRSLAPFLFEDHDRPPTPRQDPVGRARRSKAAERKVAARATDEGQPLHSFRTLLADLATIVRNRVQPPGIPAAAFEMTTIPTPLQRRVLEALDVDLSAT